MDIGGRSDNDEAPDRRLDPATAPIRRPRQPAPPTPPTPRRIGPYEASLNESRERVSNAVRRAQRRQRRVRTLIGAGSAVAVLAAVGTAIVFLRGDGSDTSGPVGVAPVARATQLVARSCPRPAELTVAVPDVMAPAFSELIKAYQAQPDIPCATFNVLPRPASAVAQGLAGPVRPDAWVIDAPVWLEQANSRAGLGLVADKPFATSPVVIAMNGQAEVKAGDTGWAGLATGEPALALPDPSTSTVGLLALAAAGDDWSTEARRQIADRSRAVANEGSLLVAAADATRAIAAPASLAAISAYNAANPGRSLAAVAPVEGAAPVEYSLVAVSDGTVASRVLRSVRDFLASNAAGAIVSTHGFSAPGAATAPESGSSSRPQPPSPDQAPTMPVVQGTPRDLPQPGLPAAESLRRDWSALTPGPRAVLALDTSGSTMGRMDKETILAKITESAQSGIASLPDHSTVSVWLFSQHLGTGGEDYRVIADSGPLTRPAQVQTIAKGLASMPGVAGGGRGLYDTIVAATQAASLQAAAGAPNTAVVVTAGPNDDDFGASLGEVKAALGKTSTSAKPARLVIIGVGDKPNATILTEVAQSTGGAYLAATTADELSEAVGSALAGRP